MQLTSTSVRRPPTWKYKVVFDVFRCGRQYFHERNYRWKFTAYVDAWWTCQLNPFMAANVYKRNPVDL